MSPCQCYHIMRTKCRPGTFFTDLVHHSWAVFVVDDITVYFLSLFTFRYHFLPLYYHFSTCCTCYLCYTFEYAYKWWRGNCENSPLPTIGSAFQCVKVDLPFCINICTCAYVLKWCLALFFFFCWKRLIYLLSRTETTAQRYLWLNRRAVVKGIQIASASFICILKALYTPEVR